MRATAWEFRFRAALIAIIFGAGFAAYAWDHQNAVVALSNWAGAGSAFAAHLIAQSAFWVAALLVAASAVLRTWGAAYLRADVVYAPAVKTALLVADGPFRRTRNPLTSATCC